MTPTTSTPLRVHGTEVAVFVDGQDVDPVLSPRPYLHPVRTPRGVAVTEVRPDDHRHHLGVGVAVADVNGISFWGGRTFTRDRGSVLLDNHGRQSLVRPPHGSEQTLSMLLSWTAPDGIELLREQRDLGAAPLGADAWALTHAGVLHNTSGTWLRIGSPATNGRPRAGYSGFFWRAVKTGHTPRCFGSLSGGEEELHGSRAEWVALAGWSPQGAPWTLAFAQTGPRKDPWFVRAGHYPGVGTALAWDTELLVPPDGTVERRILTVVADGHPDPEVAAELVAQARTTA
jgi:hypothetical protein